MTIVFIGASGSGKSTLEKEFAANGYHKIVSYTTRNPREGEVNGKDYYFISNDTFDEMLQRGLFAEYEEYSQGRKYGTLISDYADSSINKVVVLTPNGLRQLKKNVILKDIYSVLVTSNLGTRIKRYIDRIGVEDFTFDDKNEIMSRVERDYGMFLGLEDETDMVVSNENPGDIQKAVNSIKEYINIW